MGTPTVDAARLYRCASAEFATRVRLVGDRWSAPTPCPGWDIRALVHHIVAEQRWAPPLFDGLTVAQVGDRLSGDLLGHDPTAAFEEASTAAAAAVHAHGAMHRTVHLSFGDVSGTEYTLQLAADHLVHAWDLGRALDLEVRLDPEAIAAVGTWFEGNEDAYRAAGVIGPRGTLPSTGGPQERLLTMFGRNP